MTSPSLGWERLKDVYYRNRELYQLSWNKTTLKNELIAIAKFSRTIASFKTVLELQDAPDNSEIEIFTASGELITSINWKKHINGRISDLKWTDDEKLVVVLQNGVIRVYYDFESDFVEYEIGFNATLVGVKDCKTVGSNIMILLNDYKIVYIDLKNELSVNSRLFKDLTVELNNNKVQDVNFHCWEVSLDSNGIQILISVNKSIFRVPKYGKIVETSVDGPFQSIRVSENKEFVALYNSSNHKLFFLTSNFNKILLTFTLDSVPSQIRWCGSDAIAASYSDHVKLIAPGGSLDFYIGNEFKIQSEVDGLTILSTESMEFLSKIPSETVDCFKIGSTSKASILIDSIDKLNVHSPKANENLQIIGSEKNLVKAIMTCIMASLEEFDPYWQKKLLKAASFGKSSIEFKYKNFECTETFVNTCKNLRIINAIRSAEVGIFLTLSEFNELGIENVLKLLIDRQKFSLAFQLSTYLNLPIDLIFIDWACSKIKYNAELTDDDLSKVIITKFQQVNNNNYISFEKISTIAFQEGRSNLAKILINFESLFTKQIPLLLKMEEHELALDKAVESQDIDLILQTLLILQETLSLPLFFKLLNNSKVSSNVFEYFNASNFKLIHDYYNQADRIIDIANFEIKNQLKNETEALRVLSNALNSYGLIYKNSNDHKQLEKQYKLTTIQQSYSNEFNIDFSKLSIVETLEKLILLNQNNKVDHFCKTFKINEKKFYNIKLNYLINNGKFDELYEWAISKKPPIGYEIFLQKTLQKGQLQLSLKFLEKATSLSYEKKFEYLVRLKQYKRAVDEAITKKDLSKLQELQKIVTNPILQTEINEQITKLSSSSTSMFF